MDGYSNYLDDVCKLYYCTISINKLYFTLLYFTLKNRKTKTTVDLQKDD